MISSLVLGDLIIILESLTPSVNAPIESAKLISF
jgi:hypothetical protein